MKGCCYRRPGQNTTWTVKIEARDATGSRRPKYKSGFATKKEAERYLHDALAKIGRGEFIAPSQITVGEYLTGWLPSLETRGLRPTTRTSYAMHVSGYVIPRIGDLRLQQLAPSDLNAFYSDLLREGRLHPGKGSRALSARTVRYCATILRRALQDAMRQGLVSRNVADLADPPGASAARESAERARNAWTPGQLSTFLGHAQAHRLAAAFVLLGTTGARRGEILGLRWSDVDLVAARLTIAQTVVLVGREVQFGLPKTRAGRRTIALDPESVRALREHRKRQLEEGMALGRGQSELVFCREDGRPLHPSTFTHTFGDLVRTSGLPRIRVHDLRHTWASLALAAGVPAKNVSERLGHAGIQITLDLYTHTTPDQDERAANAVANLVFGETPR